MKYWKIDEYTENFLREVYEKELLDKPDYPVEVKEEAYQVLYSLAKQLVTGKE